MVKLHSLPSTRLLLAILCMELASCGSGGVQSSSNGNQSPSSTITSVLVSCAPTSVQNGLTAQCSAAVSGTGSYSSAVTWSTDFGTIDASGKYTAPASGTGTATVVGTSQQDSTKSGSATITVTAQTSQTSLTPTGPMAVPSILVSGQQTQVTITSFVEGSDTSTQVQLFNLSGGTSSLIGAMSDNGQGGDQVAGDHVYTITTTLTAPAAASLPLKIVASGGTASSGSVDFSVQVTQIPSYATASELNQAEAQLFNTAVQTRTMLSNPDWTSQSFISSVITNLISMFDQFETITNQSAPLQSIKKMVRRKRTNRQLAGTVSGTIGDAFTSGLLSPGQDLLSCSQLLESLSGYRGSYPNALPLSDPQLIDFADELVTICSTASDCQSAYSYDDFLGNSFFSTAAAAWANTYVVTHSLPTPISGCSGGFTQSAAGVAVKAELGQFTDLAGQGIAALADGGQIAMQAGGQAASYLFGWLVDSSGNQKPVVAQVAPNETFSAPAGTYNLAASFGGDTANGTITNTPVFSKSTTDVSPSAGTNITVTPPYVTALTPSLGPAGTTVAIAGSGFDTDPAGNQVTFNGTTAQVSGSTATSLQTTVPMGATSGPVTVTTSSGSTTSSMDFAVSGVTTNPVPSISSLSPGSLPAGGSPQTLTINGTGFLATSSVSFNGVTHTSTVVSNSQLTISLTSADLSTPGSFPVVVTNPSPGGGASNTVDFVVGNPVPTVTSLSPSSVAAGAAAQTLTITGNNFLTTSTVSFNGSTRAPTFVSSTQLTIALTTADIATAGTFPVSVTNPSPGGGTSNVIDFTVTAGSAGSVTISPSSVNVPEGGAQVFTATVAGSSSGVTWSVQEGSTGGALSQFGIPNGVLYRPPSSTGTFHVVATSVDDPSQSATATVTVVAMTYVALHSFQGTSQGDGATPYGNLIQASDGNFYGTTAGGGVSASCSSTGGCGTVFRMDASGNVTLLHSFSGSSGSDGSSPRAGLIQAKDSNFYGAAAYGGASGNGTIFQMDTSGNTTVLFSFSVLQGQGSAPQWDLIQASDGNLYGTTQNGGPSGDGTIFKIDTSGNMTILHSFSGPDGTHPWAGLIQAKDGNFYGAAAYGGASGDGTIFKMDASGNVTTLHSFSGPDGKFPEAALIQASDGNFYGTTLSGGADNLGTIFKMDASGNVTVLHSFFGGDGANPRDSLIEDSNGNFYGTTSSGGSGGAGIVFKMDASGNLTILHLFSSADGANPFDSLLIGTDGNLYGTTTNGGAANDGVVFRLGLP